MKRIVVCMLSLLMVSLLVSFSLLGTSASELEQELIESVGALNEDSKFDLLIEAPESYRAGDDITVTVSVVNISPDVAIDYLSFTFYYDQTKLFITNDIDEGNQGGLICIDIDRLGGQWEHFCQINSNFNDLSVDDIRKGAQAVPNNDGVINASILTTSVYFDSITEDDVIVFEFTFNALADSTGDIGLYIPHDIVKGGQNGDTMLFFEGTGGYAIICEDTSAIPDDSSGEDEQSSNVSSAISSDEASDNSDISSEHSDDSIDTSSDESSEMSDETSNDTSSDIPVNPELENELIGLVGTPNANPKFDLVITAPERYKAGDDIVVTVSVRNITSEYGLDYLKFLFKYDNTKLMLTNDINERDQGSLVCIDTNKLGGSWENFVIVKSNFKDLTTADLKAGVQAVPENDGVIDVTVLTPTLYFDSITEDDVIVFEFTFTANEDADDDFGVYISHDSVLGALNDSNIGLDFYDGNGGYAIVTYDPNLVVPPEESSEDISSDVSSDDVSSDGVSSNESSEDTSSDESSDDMSEDISSDASSDDVSSEVSSEDTSSGESSDDVSEDVSSDAPSDDISPDESSEDTSSDESSDDVSEDISSDTSSDDVSSDVSSDPEWEIPDISVYDYVFSIDSVNGIINGEDTIIITSNDFYYECNPRWCTTIILDRINDVLYSVNRIIDNPLQDFTNVNLENGQLALVVHSAGDRPQDDYGIYENWEARAVAGALQIGDKLILDKVVLTDNRECINGTATVKESTDTSPDPIPAHGTNGIIYKLSEDGTYCYIDSYVGTENNVTIPSVYMGLPVTEIANNAFENQEITALIIPDSISNIGQNAFNGCSSLTEIYCEVQAQPDGYSEYWLGSSDASVLWGYTYEIAMEECEGWLETFNNLIKDEYCDAEWNNLQEVLNSANADLSDADTIFKLRPIIKSLEYAHLINPKAKEFADINDDEVIDVFDYLLLKRYCFKTYHFDEVQYSRGNIDRNDTIDVFDFLLLKRIAFKTYVVQ